MSGHKHATITISQDEYRRLHELDMKQRSGKKNAEDRESRYNALMDAYQLIEERQKEYENVIASMNQEMAAIETEQANDILSIQAEYYQNLYEHLEDLQEENIGTQYALQETTRYFQEVIQTEQLKAQQRFNSLLQQVTSIARNEENKESSAREWIESCTQLSDFIKERYNHHKFYPKEFDNILQRLNLAIRNLNQGLVDSGLQFAQEAFLRFSELRASLEEKTSTWQAMYQVLSDEVNSLFQEVANTPVISAIGIEGEDLNVDINLDYWTNGKYKALQKSLGKLVSMLDRHRDDIGFEDFDKLSTETIPTLRNLFSEIILEARQNALNAQIKINVAYLTMKALEKHGFSLKQTQYENGDMRNTFAAELCDEDGSNIIVRVTPNKVSHSSRLSIDTIDDTIHTEDEFMQRWMEINHSLEEAGVQVGQVQVAPHDRNPVDHPEHPHLRMDRPFIRKIDPHYVRPYRTTTPTTY